MPAVIHRWLSAVGGLLPSALRMRRRERLSGHDIRQLIIGMLAIAVAALCVIGLEQASAQTARPAAPRTINWATTTSQTAEGTHITGNPDARRKLIEFVSYTCPHCAQFERDAGSALLVGYVADGSTSVEVRHLVRDPVDLTVAMLAQCGTPRQFQLNHSALMRSHDRWMAAARTASAGQQQRWRSGSYSARMQAIASDIGLYPIMQSRGFNRRQAETCLADDAVRTKLVAMTEKASGEQNVQGTPSFMLNGVLLAGTHSWPMLETQLRARR